MLLHIVDVAGSEGRDPKEDFQKINQELEKYSEDLAQRPQIVVGNKADLATPEQIRDFQNYVEEKGFPFYVMSAATTQGVEAVKNAITAKLETLPPILEYEGHPYEDEELFDSKDRSFTVHVDDQGVYVVEGDWLLSVLGMVDPEDYESLQYMQRVLRSSGILDKLEEMGIQENDTVNILGFEFDYVK